MTKEQAIEVLHELDGSLYETQQVALDLASKALEQQSEDCVSRQAVIKSIGNNININFEGQRGLKKYTEEVKLILQCLLDEQEKRVKALPPVTPTQRWIPVSERLPGTHEEVLCWYEYYHWSQEKVLPEYGIGYYSKEMEIWCGEVASGVNAKVLAWQPLPQPYEEKRG